MDQEPDDIGPRIAKLFISWAGLLIVGTLFYQAFLDEKYNPNQQPDAYEHEGYNEVILKRNAYGHYVAKGEINHYPVTFLLDTGATSLSIPSKVANVIGLNAGLPYEVSTANGNTTVYATTLDSVSIGNIEQYDVRGAINPSQSDQDEILLGMSFLKHLTLIQQGDVLILRQ